MMLNSWRQAVGILNARAFIPWRTWEFSWQKLHEDQQEEQSFVPEVEQEALCIHMDWGPLCWRGLRVLVDSKVSIIGGFYGFMRQNHDWPNPLLVIVLWSRASTKWPSEVPSKHYCNPMIIKFSGDRRKGAEVIFNHTVDILLAEDS